MNMHTPCTYVARVIMTGYCVHMQNNISDTCACVLRMVVCRQYRFLPAPSWRIRSISETTKFREYFFIF